MSWLAQLSQDHPEIALFLVLGIGYAVVVFDVTAITIHRSAGKLRVGKLGSHSRGGIVGMATRAGQRRMSAR